MIRFVNIIVYVVFAAALFSCGPDLDTDEGKIEHFQRNRKKIEHLVRLIQKETVLEVVRRSRTTPDWEELDPEARKRVEHYRKLLKEANLQDFYVMDEESMLFGVHYSGFLTSGYSESYLYTTETPEPLVENLNDYLMQHIDEDNFMAYRKIDENWYIWLVWDL